MYFLTTTECLNIFCRAMEKRIANSQGDYNQGVSIFHDIDQLVYFLGRDNNNEADALLGWLLEQQTPLKLISSDHDFQTHWQKWADRLEAVRQGDEKNKPETSLGELISFLLEIELSAAEKLTMFIDRIIWLIKFNRHSAREGITIMDRLGSVSFSFGSTDQELAQRMLNFLNQDIRRYLAENHETFKEYQGRNLVQELQKKIENYKEHLEKMINYQEKCDPAQPSHLDSTLNLILHVMK